MADKVGAETIDPKVEAFHHVVNRIKAAIEDYLGTEVEGVSLDDDTAICGFNVDGVPYSLGVNITP